MKGAAPFSFALFTAASLVEAAVVTYNWNVTWVLANPDGQQPRAVIGINNVWPCPKIEGNAGDTVVINLNNHLGNQTTGIHFHGINQINTEEMDGPSGITQCPVPPGSSIKYEFLLDEPGTFWYHSHNMGQYPDGLRGPLIVHNPNDPYKDEYQEEVILTVSDWYHGQSVDLVRTMLASSNTRFAPPIPDNIIVNEGAGALIDFKQGKTYRVRIISYSALASVMIHFDSHTMQVIMNDATYIQKAQAYQLRVQPSQRYDVLISCIDRDNYNFPFLASLDINRDFENKALGPATWPHNYTGYLVMNSKWPTNRQDVVDVWRPVDDSHFLPLDKAPILQPVSRNIVLDFAFCRFDDSPRACFNNQPMIPQKVPSLYTAATVGTANTNPVVYGAVNPFIIHENEIVQVVINNLDVANHPFHVHGHQFQVLDRPGAGTGRWSGHNNTFAQTPPRRDTVGINGNSFAVLRYKATNPGVWLVHCHIEWHVEMGLTATFIEAPEKLRGMKLPADHLELCRQQKIPIAGNAGGNTVNYTDTTNYNTAFPPVYEGSMYTAPASR